MTIKITIDGETVHEIDARAYRKRIMHVDLRNAHASVKQEHIDLPLIRDLDINIVFDSRADTDLAMLEEKARLDDADKDAERAEEAEKVTDTPEEEKVPEDSPVDDDSDVSDEPDGDEPDDSDDSADDDGPLDLNK